MARGSKTKPAAQRPKRRRVRVPVHPDELLHAEELFVAAFVRLGEISPAAKAAKISTQRAKKFLGLDRVQRAIEAKRAKVVQRLGFGLEAVIDELRKIAFADMRQLAAWGPRGVDLLPSDTISDDAAAAVSKVTQKRGKSSEISIETHSKVQALTLLGKHFGGFVERVKLDNPEEIARQIAAQQAAIAGTPGAFPAPPAPAQPAA